MLSISAIKEKLMIGSRKKKEILINIEPLETRVVVLDEGRLDNFHIERAEENKEYVQAIRAALECRLARGEGA